MCNTIYSLIKITLLDESFYTQSVTASNVSDAIDELSEMMCEEDFNDIANVELI